MERVNRVLNHRASSIILLVVLDIIVLAGASFLALWLRFDFNSIPAKYIDSWQNYLFIDIFIMLLYFLCMKLYTSMWSYASITELLSIIIACCCTVLTEYLYKTIFDISMPNSWYFIELVLIIAFVSMVRFSQRVYRSINAVFNIRKSSTKMMLIGAGDAGRMVIDEVMNNQSTFDTKIVCIIDDNRRKKGSYIRGIPVCGNHHDIPEMVEKYHVEKIIIAIPSASKETIDKIVTECHKTKCEIMILPSIYLTMNEKEHNVLKNIRPLSYEDFLGRDQIVVDINEIKDNIKDKVILVTGGGGSIGSELCRQIAKSDPKMLIIYDIYENNAYDIQQELLRNFPNLDLHTIIGSVRDYDRLEKVFKEFHPQQVYHAAAHKHVPLMEVSPNEAIKNNCLGTLNACKLANIYEVERFVLISTDKAVRPTNIMGASKRICEMIIQSFDKISKKTDFVAVRFGNVLGSNGSVIPLFLKQIESGGPVTVTHKDIRRFFMTIPEAVSLVLQAACYAEGGEIFVLDMGESVKIYDLAEKLIRYKGFEPGKDISIVITGLRPGEKLYEEILMDEEGMKETPNKLIHIGKPIRISSTFMDDLEKLIKDAYKNKDTIKDEVAEIVNTYTVDKERVGK